MTDSRYFPGMSMGRDGIVVLHFVPS